MDCLTDLKEELHAAGYVEASIITIFIDVFAFDVVHREVEPTVFRYSCFKQCRDVRVLCQRGLNVNLVLESHKMVSLCAVCCRSLIAN